ncbi:hypothetical protein CHUAL_010887 [Chamberlinius hualienensis]
MKAYLAIAVVMCCMMVSSADLEKRLGGTAVSQLLNSVAKLLSTLLPSLGLGGQGLLTFLLQALGLGAVSGTSGTSTGGGLLGGGGGLLGGLLG